jgi:hypothetical protein
VSMDLVALCRELPSRDTVIAALVAAGPDLTVTGDESGAVVRLLDQCGRPLFAVEAPLLVQVAGEVERLLGVVAEVPVWWVEIRAVSGRDDAAEAARRFAERLAGTSEGAVWPA